MGRSEGRALDLSEDAIRLGNCGVFAVFALIPTWDTFVNRIYHKQVICKRPEIGLHVFENVRLPVELYDTRGTPLIFDRYGNFDVNKVGNRYKEDESTNTKVVC